MEYVNDTGISSKPRAPVSRRISLCHINISIMNWTAADEHGVCQQKGGSSWELVSLSTTHASKLFAYECFGLLDCSIADAEPLQAFTMPSFGKWSTRLQRSDLQGQAPHMQATLASSRFPSWSTVEVAMTRCAMSDHLWKSQWHE